jgi:hypothetical protein
MEPPSHSYPPVPTATRSPDANQALDEATGGLNTTSVAAMFEGLAQAMFNGGIFNSAQTINVNITVNTLQVPAPLNEQSAAA